MFFTLSKNLTCQKIFSWLLNHFIFLGSFSSTYVYQHFFNCEVKNHDPNALKKKEMKECSIKSAMPITERKDVLKCVTSLFLQSDLIRSLLVPSLFYSPVADWASVREKPLSWRVC